MKKKKYCEMSIEELEKEIEHVLETNDNSVEVDTYLIEPLEEIIRSKIKDLPKPKITDGDSWWTGRNRIKTFASWQDAVAYWESMQKSKK